VRAVVVIGVDDHGAFDRDRLLLVAAVEQDSSAEPADDGLAGLVQRGFRPDRSQAFRRLRFGFGLPQREALAQFQLGAAGKRQQYAEK